MFLLLFKGCSSMKAYNLKCTNGMSHTYCCLSVLRIRVFLLCKTNGKASILFNKLVQDNLAFQYVISLTI